MNDTIKGSIYGAFITVAGSVLVFYLGNFSTQATLEKNTVEMLSEYFDSVDKDMSYKQALQTVYKENKALKDKVNKLNDNTYNVEYFDVNTNINGESKNEYKNGYVVIDNKEYISFNILDELIDEEINLENNILYIGHSSAETANLMDECPPHDVSSTYLYNTDPFKMCGKQYSNGFTMQSPDKYYALINLNEKFSKLEFDFGHVDDSGDYSATVNIYLDDNLAQTIEKNSDEYVSHETVNLNYAQQLKIEINTGHAGYFGEYGFGNMILTY